MLCSCSQVRGARHGRPVGDLRIIPFTSHRAACSLRLNYDFAAFGGNCLNIFSTPLSRLRMFLLELFEIVSLEQAAEGYQRMLSN